jgi:hypothetical protein
LSCAIHESVSGQELKDLAQRKPLSSVAPLGGW